MNREYHIAQGDVFFTRFYVVLKEIAVAAEAKNTFACIDVQ